jgi:hypothetical protein
MVLGIQATEMTEIRGLLARILEFSDRCYEIERLSPTNYGM